MLIYGHFLGTRNQFREYIYIYIKTNQIETTTTTTKPSPVSSTIAISIHEIVYLRSLTCSKVELRILFALMFLPHYVSLQFKGINFTFPSWTFWGRSTRYLHRNPWGEVAESQHIEFWPWDVGSCCCSWLGILALPFSSWLSIGILFNLSRLHFLQNQGR